MKNPILGLRTAIYRVNDISAAKQWYARAFKVQPYFDEPFYVGFDIGGFELGLQAEGGAQEDKPESVVAYWCVEDLHEPYMHFRGTGLELIEELRIVGVGIMMANVW